MLSVVICCWNVVAVAGVDTVAVMLVVAAILDSNGVVVVVVSGFVEAVPMALVFVGGDVAPGGGVIGAVVLACDVDVLSCWPSSPSPMCRPEDLVWSTAVDTVAYWPSSRCPVCCPDPDDLPVWSTAVEIVARWPAFPLLPR